MTREETRVGPWPFGFLAWVAGGRCGLRVSHGNVAAMSTKAFLPKRGRCRRRRRRRPSRDGSGVSVWRDGVTDTSGRARDTDFDDVICFPAQRTLRASNP
ncbi:hypothetical protein LX36DRAFT_445582 [Colletotrichum falcatum]|nr:hypothetical protein LX36DRAFT_445582 [Colletotrichum falcatum]